MTIKTLLTVTGPTHSNDDLVLAADLASSIGAHLSELRTIRGRNLIAALGAQHRKGTVIE